MEKLRESKKWVPGYVEVERLLKEARKIAEKKGLKEGKKIGMEKGAEKEKIKMAKMMKKNREPIEKILMYTGLSKTEIEEL
jgi:predicted transposase/invertase (TIGR01784 family)